MKRHTTRNKRRAARTPRANGASARPPRRLRALAGVDPRLLAPGTLYPCDDPRVGTVVPGGRTTPGGRVVACASRGPAGRGHDLFVGGMAVTPRQIAAARSFSGGEARRAQRRAERPRVVTGGTRGGRRRAAPAAPQAPQAHEVTRYDSHSPRPSAHFGPGGLESARRIPLGYGAGGFEDPRPIAYGPRESLGVGGFEDPRSAPKGSGYTVAQGRATVTASSAEKAVAAAEAAVAECVAAWEAQRGANTARRKKGAFNVAQHREKRAEAAVDRAVRAVGAPGASEGSRDRLLERLRVAASHLGARADGSAYTVESKPPVPLERPKRGAAGRPASSTGRAFGKAAPLDCDASPVRDCNQWRIALGYFERLAPFLPASAKQARQRIANLRAWLEGDLPDAEFWQRGDYGDQLRAVTAEESALGVGLIEAIVINATRGIGHTSNAEYVKSAGLDALTAVELALAEENGKPVDFLPLLEATGLDDHFAKNNRSLSLPPPPAPEEAVAAVLEYVRTHTDGESFASEERASHQAGSWADWWRAGLRGEMPSLYSQAQREALTLRGALYRALLPYARHPKKLGWDSPPYRTLGNLREKFGRLHHLATVIVAQQAGLTDPAGIVEREFRAKVEALRSRYEALSREHIERFGAGFAASRRAIANAAKAGASALDQAMRDTPTLRPAAARAGRDEYLSRLQAQIARLDDFGKGPEGTQNALRGLANLARGDISLDHYEPPFKTDGAYGRPLRLAIEKFLANPLARLAFEALAAMNGAATGRKNDSYEATATWGDKRMLGAAWIDSDAEALDLFDKARTESAFALWRTMVSHHESWAHNFDMSPNTRYLRNLPRPGEGR